MKKAALTVVSNNTGRLVLPLFLHQFREREHIRYVLEPFRMDAYEFDNGAPQRLYRQFREHMRPRIVARDLLVHETHITVFLYVPQRVQGTFGWYWRKRFDLDSYLQELQQMCEGLTYHHRDPDIVDSSKFMANPKLGYSSIAGWFDMERFVLFSFRRDCIGKFPPRLEELPQLETLRPPRASA